MNTSTIIERFVSIETIRERYESVPDPEYLYAPEEVKPDKGKRLKSMKKAIEKAYELALKEIEKTEIDENREVLHVDLTGEIYLVNDEFSNQNIEKEEIMIKS